MKQLKLKSSERIMDDQSALESYDAFLYMKTAVYKAKKIRKIQVVLL